MAVVAGQMNFNNTAAASYADAMATGQMVLRVVSTTGNMKANDSGSGMPTASHATAGLMTLIIDS